jgi:hypothetical protein
MDKRNITGGKTVIADELKILFDDLKADIVAVRTDLTLINHDILKIREQLNNIEMNINSQPVESIGIAPNTPPGTFLGAEPKFPE